MTQEDKAAERFAENFDKFFECLNVSNYVIGKCSKNVFKNPTTRRILKWWEKILWRFIDISIVNSWIIFHQNYSDTVI